MHRRLALLAICSLVVGCGEVLPPRGAAIVAALVDADEVFIRARPALAAGKYARMARDPYSYFRGTVPIYRADFRDLAVAIGVTRFPAIGPLPPSLGDPHPENFGLLEGSDGLLALEANDLDSADRFPYHWDLRRLTTGLALACRLGNPTDEAQRAAVIAAESDVVRAAVEAYADGIATGARDRIGDDDAPLVADLFRRGRRDQAAHAELVDLTTLVDGARRLRRGVLDVSDPEEALHELPPWGIDALPPLLTAYRRTLISDPGPEVFTVLDAARQVGSGVASWPRVRVLVLVRGPSDAPEDDLILEVKEQLDSGADGWLPPGTYADDVPDRILRTTRAAWASPDAEPFWGAGVWLGYPVQVRRESAGHKTLRIDRIEESEGTAAAMISLARTLGRLLARVHTTPVAGAEGAREAIDRAIARDRAAFVADEIGVAASYADRVLVDHELFRDALRMLGPTLGVPRDERDRASAELRALFGDPETVRGWE